VGALPPASLKPHPLIAMSYMDCSTQRPRVGMEAEAPLWVRYPQKLTGLISLYTNPVSILSVL
jgi:hypothetical protein